MSLQCYNCNQELNLSEMNNIPRSETCPKCLSDIRSCKMCTFYDPKSYNECREPSAERIVEKEKANYCDYYKLGSSKSNTPSKDDLFKLADSLFKK